jgi:tRNA threonylcarbamoyladenosine biosynthesis protein TsaB
MGGRQMNGPLLVLDTATRSPVVALADERGELIGARQWQSRHRHSEELLERLDDLLTETGVDRRALGGVIVGTGPGSFTGLRIGLATAKVIAYGLDVPLVAISTTLALANAARKQSGTDRIAVTLPAGASDSYVHLFRGDREDGPPRLVGSAGDVADSIGDATLVAVDAQEGAAEEAVERGHKAVARLAAALAELGSEALAEGDTADPAQLVPAYVALPRGIARAAAEMEWSPDLR